jgi:hypothetical protein
MSEIYKIWAKQFFKENFLLLYEYTTVDRENGMEIQRKKNVFNIFSTVREMYSGDLNSRDDMQLIEMKIVQNGTLGCSWRRFKQFSLIIFIE